MFHVEENFLNKNNPLKEKKMIFLNFFANVLKKIDKLIQK